MLYDFSVLEYITEFWTAADQGGTRFNLYLGTSISKSLVNDVHDELACKVVNTKCPVSAASSEDSAVSGSRVSPIKIISGSFLYLILPEN